MLVYSHTWFACSDEWDEPGEQGDSRCSPHHCWSLSNTQWPFSWQNGQFYRGQHLSSSFWGIVRKNIWRMRINVIKIIKRWKEDKRYFMSYYWRMKNIDVYWWKDCIWTSQCAAAGFYSETWAWWRSPHCWYSRHHNLSHSDLALHSSWQDAPIYDCQLQLSSPCEMKKDEVFKHPTKKWQRGKESRKAAPFQKPTICSNWLDCSKWEYLYTYTYQSY